MTEQAVVADTAQEAVPAATKTDTDQDTTPPIKDRSLKKAFGDFKHAGHELFKTARYHTVRALPAFFINNSSNILGTAHVGTEILMFKASLKDSELVPGSAGPFKDITYIPKALKHVFSDAFSKSGRDMADLKNAVKERPFTGFFRHIMDTDTATQREMEKQLGFPHPTKPGVTVTRETMSLGNPWQTRSTLSGLIVWSLSALIPDKKESSDEVEQMAILKATHPVKYVGERLRQAVWIPEWPQHKRQMIGLGIFISGLCSMIGSNRNHITTAEGKKYAFNVSYLLTGIMTFMSSLPLLFASDDQRGFSGFGAWMTGRLMFLPSSIYKKISGKEQGAWYYTGATCAFQVENWTQALAGGAEKRNGVIIDRQELLEQAKEKAEHIKAERRLKGNSVASAAEGFVPDEKPGTKVTTISNREAAMPERADAQKEMANAAI